MNQLPRSITKQIARLQQRGMLFPDMNAAVDLFSRVSYSRLKYYWQDMLDGETGDNFVAGTIFTDVIQRYAFDHEFRVILFDAIETVEVALRTKIIDIMSQYAGNGLWYLDSSLFEDAQRHEDFVLDLKYEFGRSTEPFAKKYIAEHDDWNSRTLGGNNPDAWLIIEVATFGMLSKMIKNLKAQMPQRSSIANSFGHYSSKDFANWVEVMSLMRNIVAHHSRLWNRSLGKKLVNPKGHRDPWLISGLTEEQKKKPYAIACAIAYTCNAINPQQKFAVDLKELESRYPTLSLSKYGFPKDWKAEPLWR